MIQRKSTLLFFLFFFLFSFSINLKAQTQYPDPLLNLSDECGEKGDTVCVQFEVDNFIDVEAFIFQISYNRNIVEPLQPLRFPDLNVPQIIQDNTAPIFNFESLGYILVNYVGFDKETLPDNTILFELCFKIIGEPGDSTPVFINPVFPDSGIVQPEFQEPGSPSVTVPFVIKNGSVKVKASQLTITSSACDATNPTNTNGVVEFMIAGGTPPYSYMLAPVGFSGTGVVEGQRIRFENMMSRNYSLTVTDAMSNMRTINILVSNTLPYTYTLVGKDPDCANRDIPNGSATITITDPGPYTASNFKYEWSNFIFNTTDNVNLGNGEYFVTIVDPSGCRVYDSVEIFREPMVVSYEIIQEESCPGLGDGIVKITASGGLPFTGSSYVVRLDGIPQGRVPMMATVTGIRGGDRSLNIIDSLNCFETINFFMPTKEGVKLDTLFINGVTCFQGGDGRVSIGASESGNSNFTFILRLGTQIIAGGISSPDTYTKDFLPGGNYSLTVISSLTGCIKILFFTITEPPAIDLTNTLIINPSCGSNIGSITLQPLNGVSPYFYKWSHDILETGNSVSGLSPGNYSVTVTDANGCTQDTTIMLRFDIVGTPPLTNTRVTREISCFGGSDGEVTLDVIPDTPTLMYEWRLQGQVNIVSTQKTAGNLSAGTYIVLIKDGTCNVLDTVVLNNPVGMNIDINLTIPTCPGLRDGSIGAVVTGGNPTYTYQWFPEGSSVPIGLNSVLAPVKAGNYLLILIDSKNCRQDTLISLVDPAKIEIDLIEVNGVNCFGLANGRADVIANGGTTANPLFNYLWSTSPLDSGPLAFNLPAGRNWVIAFDALCVSDTLFFDVPTVQKIRLSNLTTFTNPACFSSTDGSITAFAQGGVDTLFRFNWLVNPPVSGNTISGLGAGTFYVRLIDSTGCFVIDSVTLTEPDSFALFQNSFATQLLSCRNTNGGQIGVVASGGNPGTVSYAWNFQNRTGPIISDLSAGNYCATATDPKGCTAEYCFELTSPPPVTGRVADAESPPCFGEKTKLCIDFISGGTGNKYSFQINQGQRFPADSCVDVFAGTYTINLIDSAGCFIDTMITIDQPDLIEIELVDFVEVILGEKSEIIIPKISSGIGIRSIQWSPFSAEIIECQTPDCAAVIFNPVNTQIFEVLVTDINNCTALDEIEVRVKDFRDVSFPNIFSPKEEGGRNSNSYFNIKTGKGVTEVVFLNVYDRWGNRVFNKSNFIPDDTFTDGWDGTFNGKLLESAVFVYHAVVRFKDGVELPYTGAITLVR
ncbi:MAG: gliding motility-associated C-terminal domain-containing protein [Saprospiraceae bacterium]|nr:gliding motility-associated C-terminal domain-containing protein [Saprospiraceae bacterium]